MKKPLLSRTSIYGFCSSIHDVILNPFITDRDRVDIVDSILLSFMDRIIDTSSEISGFVTFDNVHHD